MSIQSHERDGITDLFHAPAVKFASIQERKRIGVRDTSAVLVSTYIFIEVSGFSECKCPTIRESIDTQKGMYGFRSYTASTKKTINNCRQFPKIKESFLSKLISVHVYACFENFVLQCIPFITAFAVEKIGG